MFGGVWLCKDKVWFYPKNRNWLTTLLLCLRYNGFKFINSNDAFVFKKTSAKLFFVGFWNTLTRFYYMLLYMFESFLTVSTTFRICPCVCKTRKGNRKKLVILDWCCPKNKMFLIVFCLFGLILPSTGKSQLSLLLPVFFCYKDGLCVYVFFCFVQ